MTEATRVPQQEKMHFKMLVALCLIGQLRAERDVIADYFGYKDVKSVVAFSCGNITSDARLVKMLNDLGISVAITRPASYPGVRRSIKSDFRSLGVFLDLQCGERDFVPIFAESSACNYFDNLHKWLISVPNLDDSLRLLNDTAFSILTDVTIAVPATSGFTLYDVFNHSKKCGGTLIVTELGSWDIAAGLNVTLTRDKFRRRANLHGIKLKVISVMQYRPNDARIEDYLEDYATRSQDSMSKFTYAIMLHLGDFFNFTMQVSETKLWHKVEENGTQSGMIGMLHRSLADLGASPAVMTTERVNLAEVIGPIWPFRTCFMFRSISTKVKDAFLRPFAVESWYSISFLAAFAVLVLASILAVESLANWPRQCEIAAFLTVGVLCQQGSTYVPKNAAGRIAFLNVLLFSILIYTYYSASVVSARLKAPIDKMNDSLNQLAKSNLPIAAEPIPYTDLLLTTSPDWEVKTFNRKRWAKTPQSKRYLPIAEGLEKVAEGGFAYHTDPNTAYPFVERLFGDQVICELTEVHLFRPQLMALWTTRKSPFTEMMRIGLTKISNAGLRQRQLKRWMSRKPHCKREMQSVQSVTMLEATTAFLLLIVGLMLSLGIFAVESTFYKLSERRRKLGVNGPMKLKALCGCLESTFKKRQEPTTFH